MNSNLIPLLYPLQPGFMDADQWIDQLLNSPATINWQAAFRHSLDTDTVGACIFDVDQNTGCLLYTSPSPRDRTRSRMPSSA